MIDSLDILRTDDFVEHHGVKGMHWGVRKQKSSSKKIPLLKRLNDRAVERSVQSVLKRTKKRAAKEINKLEKKQNKLAKPYADKNGHFKITDPKKAAKHSEYSEKIVNLKKLIKQIDEGKKEVNKKYSGTSMDYMNHQAHLQAHQNAVQQHMLFMNQVQQQNTLQTIQNFHNQMHFDMMNNMHTLHMHNMHTMGMF